MSYLLVMPRKAFYPMKYLIYSEDTLIGWSPLDKGDPPMAIVSGVFYPNPSSTKV